MQFVLLVWSSFEFAFRIQERLGRGEGYNDTYAARVSTFVLAIIIVAGCSIPLLTVLLHHGLTTQELLWEQVCPVGGTCRCCASQTTCHNMSSAQSDRACILHLHTPFY